MVDPAPDAIRLQRLASGHRLAWRQSGQGHPLVLLHGWSMSGAVFSEVACSLESDFQLLRPDLHGHGGSDPTSDFRLDRICDDILEWLQVLGLEQVALLGWSLGGQVAMALARREPRLVSRLLLISTTPCFCRREGWMHGLPPGQVQAMQRQLRQGYHRALGEFFDLQFADENLSPQRRQQLLAFAVKSSRLPLSEDCLAALKVLSAGDYRSQLKMIHCPTLVMHGQQDRIIPWRAGRHLSQELPDAEWRLIPEVGHAPFLSQPDLCVRTWKDFLV